MLLWLLSSSVMMVFVMVLRRRRELAVDRHEPREASVSEAGLASSQGSSRRHETANLQAIIRHTIQHDTTLPDGRKYLQPDLVCNNCSHRNSLQVRLLYRR